MDGIEFMSRSGNRYVYDDNSGQIFNLQGRDAEEVLAEYREKMGSTEDGTVGIVSPDDVEDYCVGQGHGFRQLILNVTDECNFRCRYCCFSDHYHLTRGYSGHSMSKETAEKAVDLYFAYMARTRKSNPLLEPFVGFYGGEPLLNFDVIRHTVEYIKAKYGQYKIGYNITTNGYLLKGDIADYLVSNRFSILVSIDGDRETHDRNRVMIDGTGTFDVVYSNICDLVKKYPEYTSISASACFDYRTDFTEVERFFETSGISLIKYSMIEKSNSTYYDRFTQEDIELYQRRMQRLWEKILILASNGEFKGDKFLFRSFGVGFMEMAYHRMIGDFKNSLISCTGACVPGEKIMVSSDGTLNICERINCHFPIGDVDSGIDFSAISRYINQYNDAVGTHCKGCPVKKLCSHCFVTFAKDGFFQFEPQTCDSFRESVRIALQDFVTLLEIDPSFADELTVKYYDYLVKEKIGGC